MTDKKTSFKASFNDGTVVTEAGYVEFTNACFWIALMDGLAALGEEYTYSVRDLREMAGFPGGPNDAFSDVDGDKNGHRASLSRLVEKLGVRINFFCPKDGKIGDIDWFIGEGKLEIAIISYGAHFEWKQSGRDGKVVVNNITKSIVSSSVKPSNDSKSSLPQNNDKNYQKVVIASEISNYEQLQFKAVTDVSRIQADVQKLRQEMNTYGQNDFATRKKFGDIIREHQNDSASCKLVIVMAKENNQTSAPHEQRMKDNAAAIAKLQERVRSLVDSNSIVAKESELKKAQAEVVRLEKLITYKQSQLKKL